MIPLFHVLLSIMTMMTRIFEGSVYHRAKDKPVQVLRSWFLLGFCSLYDFRVRVAIPLKE